MFNNNNVDFVKSEYQGQANIIDCCAYFIINNLRDDLFLLLRTGLDNLEEITLESYECSVEKIEEIEVSIDILPIKDFNYLLKDSLYYSEYKYKVGKFINQTDFELDKNNIYGYYTSLALNIFRGRMILLENFKCKDTDPLLKDISMIIKMNQEAQKQILEKIKELSEEEKEIRFKNYNRTQTDINNFLFALEKDLKTQYSQEKPYISDALAKWMYMDI